jgi:hypothetical protein
LSIEASLQWLELLQSAPALRSLFEEYLFLRVY